MNARRPHKASVAQLPAFACMLALALATHGCSSTAASSTTPLTSTPAATVPADIAAILNKPMYKGATWGLRVLDGKNVLIDLNSNKQLLVASIRKIFTVGELLDTIGPAHTFDTPVYRDGLVKGGVLQGNLIVQASGDLTMGGRTNPDGSIAISNWDHNTANAAGNAILTKPNPLAGYLSLARSVKAAGIDRVAGEIVIDDRLFPPLNYKKQFDIRPIFVNDDAVDLSVVPGARVSVTSRPLSAALTINDKLTTGATNTLAIEPTFPSCIGTPGCSATISGTLPSSFVPPFTGQDELVQTVRIVQPSNYARTVFIEALTAAGVAVDAAPVEANPVHLLPPKNSYAASSRVALLKGLPYSDDAKLILKVSYNIGSDTSLLLYGLTHHVDTETATLKLERATLASTYGISPSQYHFIDGSGGGDTTASNVAVTTMLQALAVRPAFKAFYDGLPILSKDGLLSLANDYKSNPTLRGAAEQVRAKDGTYVGNDSSGNALLKALGLGGYITSKHGKHLTFELVVNDVPITTLGDILPVLQDEATISAILWRDF
jgi:D-alanyl-D-alanine carboxypeptidase